jgi:glycosyltransferase involved in cell wall biosynthesis
MARKLAQIAGGLRRPRRNLHVLTPLVIPLPASTWARRLNRSLLIGQIRHALGRLRAGPVQVWSFTPDISYVLGNFGEQAVVYYCVDDFASFSGYDRAQVLRDEEDLCGKADLVVTTSMALQEAKEPMNPNTLLVPHGVDYDHFVKAIRQELPVPPDVAEIPRPRLGFFGLIRDWVDLGMLATVAERRPDWHFVLIGDSTVDLAPYRKLANMHFLGRRGYDELPAYCRQFDVGLIPFEVNDLTHAVNPIKLREYLAAGLPVVSTPMPEVRLYSRLIRIADSADTFMEAIEASLDTDDDKARARRARAMSAETWPQKLEAIAERLDTCLRGRGITTN